MKAIATTLLISFTGMIESENFKYLEKSIIIDASAEEVWKVLIDLKSWEEWNPFIVKSEGLPNAGTHIKNTMINDGKEYIFKPKVLKVDEHKEFVWKGKLFVGGLFDGRHGFRIEEIGPNQVRFINYENFSGILSKMILKKIKAATEANFNKMNEALKLRVEGHR